MTGCHSGGGQTPNLTESNAYNSLIIGNYINKENPENSVLYLKVSGRKRNPYASEWRQQRICCTHPSMDKQGANNN